MEIKVKTAYELGQKINENGMKGTVVRIEIIVHSVDKQEVQYILDTGGKIVIGFKES